MAVNIVKLEVPEDTHEYEYYDVTCDSDEIRTLVTADPDMVDQWISDILRIHRRRLDRLIVGLDIEWRPTFNRYEKNPVATLQLCVGRRCLIFQFCWAPREMPESLIDFLGNESFTFVGMGIEADADKLYADYGLNVSNMMDLRSLATQETGSDLRNAGLKRLAEEILGREVEKPKSVTTSAWDRAWLRPAQVKYACIDAFVPFEIGRHLLSR